MYTLAIHIFKSIPIYIKNFVSNTFSRNSFFLADIYYMYINNLNLKCLYKKFCKFIFKTYK